MKAADPALKVGAIFFRLAFARLEFNDPSFVSASELLSSTVQAVSSDSMHVAGETVGITQSRGHCAASFSLLLSRRENARDTSSKDPLYSADAGTGGSGANFIRPEFAGELFGAGQPLDAARTYIVIPDGIGHGKSSKPSRGLHARFPSYGYADMVDAQYRLLTEGLGVNHLRLVLGTSMGGMHTWVWGERYPDFMDALMPLASLPAQISGRNRVWRRMVIDAIRGDPDWKGGEYREEPTSLRTAVEMLFFMSSNPVLRQRE